MSTLERTVERLEAAHNVAQVGDLTERLQAARSAPFVPTHSRTELARLGERDDLTGRIARGWLRLGERFYLTDAPLRQLPEIDVEAALAATMGSLTHDPLGFVLFAFDWGHGDLKGLAGPRAWQREELEKLGARLSEYALVGGGAIQLAIASGNGPGKSAFASWLALFTLATFELSRVTITASSESQLRSKTAPELTRWFGGLVCRHWFDTSVTAIFTADGSHAANWRIDLLPWNQQRPESAAGLHNRGRRLLFLIDEASGVDDTIFDVAKGSMTDADTEMMFVVLGNPLRADGAFARAITKERDEWRARNIDIRSVEGINQAQVQKYVAAYGIDSDFVRTRVLGLTPRRSSSALIARADVEAAVARLVPDQVQHPVCVGLDPARFGDDESVIATRRGRDARSFPLIRMKGLDTVAVVARLIEYVNDLRAIGLTVYTFIDATGVGGGHVDVARARGLEVAEVIFGGRALDSVRHFNIRSECYAKLKEWLPTGALPDDAQLVEDLSALEYGFDGVGRLQLEKKDDLKRRIGRSPDAADALAITFAQPVVLLEDPRFAAEAAAERQRRSPLNHDPYALLEEQKRAGHDPYRN